MKEQMKALMREALAVAKRPDMTLRIRWILMN